MPLQGEKALREHSLASSPIEVRVRKSAILDEEKKEAVASPEVLAKLTVCLAGRRRGIPTSLQEVPYKDMKSQPLYEHELTAQRQQNLCR